MQAIKIDNKKRPLVSGREDAVPPGFAPENPVRTHGGGNEPLTAGTTRTPVRLTPTASGRLHLLTPGTYTDRPLSLRVMESYSSRSLPLFFVLHPAAGCDPVASPTPGCMRSEAILTKYVFPGSVSVYADALLAAGIMLKADSTVDQSKEGVVASDADIVAGTDSGASLTNDDIACLASLTTKNLHA